MAQALAFAVLVATVLGRRSGVSGRLVDSLAAEGRRPRDTDSTAQRYLLAVTDDSIASYVDDNVGPLVSDDTEASLRYQ